MEARSVEEVLRCTVCIAMMRKIRANALPVLDSIQLCCASIHKGSDKRCISLMEDGSNE